MITNEKRDMDTGDLIKLIKQKLKMAGNAKQSVQLTETRKFYKTYGNHSPVIISNTDRRIYMESRKGSMRNDTFMKKVTIIRSIYLTWLRSASLKRIKFDRKMWHTLYTKGLSLKKEILKELDDNNDYSSDKGRRYIKMAIGTMEKYNKEYLEIKTSISVEILRAIRCKYIDRFIMGFLY
jgi:hypothetical protein